MSSKKRLGRLRLSLKYFVRFFPSLLAFLVLSGVIEIAVRSGLIKDYLLPAPTQVLMVFNSQFAELASATLSTAFCALAALTMSFLIGTSTAILLSLSKFLRSAILPLATFFQTVPVIAIAPLLVIWFGFGKPTVIASAFVVSLFPLISSTLLGMESTDKALLDLFKLYSASRVDVILRLKIPFALPHIFSGLRIASGLAVIGAIVGEFIGGGGLGSLIDAARAQQRVDIVFAAVILSAVIGLVFVGCTSLILMARHR